MIQKGISRDVATGGQGKIRFRMIVGGLCVVAACLLAKHYWGGQPADADSDWQAAASSDSPPPAAAPTVSRNVRVPTLPAAQAPVGVAPATAAQKPIPQIVAVVNGEEVTREELGRECIMHHGREVLDSMINKQLIVQECWRRGITITRADVSAEIERIAKRFSLPVDQWLKLLKQERNIDVEQYGSDIIWPTLALRRLAGQRLTISRDELEQYFEMTHGEKVSVRLISCSDPKAAEKIQSQAAAHPEDFADLAKRNSEDVNSASFGGRVQPIRRHGACKEIEQAAFSMADGEVSPVISTAGQYVILKREGLLKADRVRLDDVAPQLEEVLREKKMRTVAKDVFDELKKRSSVVVVLDDPVKRRQLPGVAAVVNGTQITVRQLAEECIARCGAAVLEDAIGRKLIAQACEKQKVTVTEAELDAEVARAASLMVRLLPNGSPDVQTFLKTVVEKQGMTVEVYRRDAVWPTVALRKLTCPNVRVTEEDVQSGFEANYGPRARCRVIVLGQLRRAQQVWEMARKRLTADYFGDLAAQYSIEGSSRALRGETPPIARHCGQPELEKEAFALKPGEMSGVIQLGDKFIILFCEGYTKPEVVDLAKVRDLIVEERPQQEAAAGDVRLVRAAARDRLDRQFPQRQEPVGRAPRRGRRHASAQPPRGAGEPRGIAS